MAQVALLHTDINSGFRLSPKMGINSAAGTTQNTLIRIQPWKVFHLNLL